MKRHSTAHPGEPGWETLFGLIPWSPSKRDPSDPADKAFNAFLRSALEKQRVEDEERLSVRQWLRDNCDHIQLQDIESYLRERESQGVKGG